MDTADKCVNSELQNPFQCVKNCGHCGQLDTVDKYKAREQQNPHQCVKNCGHCGQMDTADKSVIREDQILISVSKLVDIADTWTLQTNLELGNVRICNTESNF